MRLCRLYIYCGPRNFQTHHVAFALKLELEVDTYYQAASARDARESELTQAIVEGDKTR